MTELPDLTPEQQDALRKVAEGRPYMAKDVLLSDLMQLGLAKRDDSTGDRVLTNKGLAAYYWLRGTPSSGTR